METKDTLSSCSNSEEQQMQQIQDKAKESCMVSFRQLHSHLKLLSNNDLKGTRTESGFKRAFATLFGQDLETFTGTINETESERHVSSSRSGKDTHAENANINSVNDQVPLVESKDVQIQEGKVDMEKAMGLCRTSRIHAKRSKDDAEINEVAVHQTRKR
ncbi:hypothetical protein Tco_0007204 [Tanacetum coccineum]